MSLQNVSFEYLTSALRILSADMVEKAKSGHPGMPLGMADVATVLFRDFLKFNPHDQDWLNRDRFVLSAGHGSALLYSLLHLTNYPKMNVSELQNFRQRGSLTPGHPEFGHTPGVETTTGPLGQGLATAVGMALGERILAESLLQKFGSKTAELINHHTYVIAGDGDLMEGIAQESISLTGHLKLNKLIVLFDDNQITIDGPTSLSTSENIKNRFEASGWNVRQIDGHDEQAIKEALGWAQTSDKPVLIACRTIIGWGAPSKAGTSGVHGSPLGATELEGLREKLNWPHPPFEIPAPIKNAWLEIGQKNFQDYEDWQARFKALSPLAQQFLTHKSTGEFKGAIAELKEKWQAEKPNKATRQLSQEVLETFIEKETKVIGGSADLTGSNNTKGKGQSAVSAQNYAGQYIYYGIREHAMAACMNGLALQGFLPYGGTFLCFSDYLKPALRLSALMGLQVIYVFTHDSIGLGEDGPTHQPVEHLAALRALPGLATLRPCDALEVAESWAYALENVGGPTAIVLTRQNLPTLRTEKAEDNLTQKGGYIISKAEKTPAICLIATGSEVSLACQVQILLGQQGIDSQVVSMPCPELFLSNKPAYQESVLGQAPRVIIEAATCLGWYRFLRPGDTFLGVNTFGISAPIDQAYDHFNLTPEKIAQVCIQKLSNA
jgi:transketolase